MEARELMQRVLVGLGVVMIVGYSYFALSGLIWGPQIEIVSPENGTATTTAFIAVTGKVIRGSMLSLNGATTTMDLAGNFSDRLLLAEGYNIMKVVATDRYGRTTERTIEIMLLAPSTTISTTTAEQTATTTNNF